MQNKGFSIVEILVVIVIISIGLVGLLGSASFSLKISNSIEETAQANNLAKEAMEAVRNFRDGTIWDTNGLATFTLDTSYHPEKTNDSPPKWILILGQEQIGGLSRKVVFQKVFRNAADDISETGTEDPNTKKVTVTVSWKDKSLEAVTYFTNWQQ